MANRSEIVLSRKKTERISGSNNPISDIQIGDWYWVLYEDWDRTSQRKLFCVEGVGSNHVKFARPTKHGASTGFRVHFDEFMECCNYSQEKLKE